jgi:hypothetical protein
MNRRTLICGLGLASLPSSSYAQSLRSAPSRRAWKEIPSIVVVSAENDSRLPAVREAVGFWNATFSKLGSPFRLGAITHTVGMIPVGDLYALRGSFSAKILSGTGPTALPDSVRRVDGSVIVALSDAKFFNFNAFTIGLPVHQKVLVAVQSNGVYPLTSPSGARNVIAHELGHVIGLDHDDDTTALMCGGSAWCHFSYPSEGFFPLTREEEAKLLEMYPPSWQPDLPKRWKADPPPGWIPG